MIVRQELALYNAEYCARPHIVALNKMDLEDAAELQDEVSKDIMAAAKAMQVSQCRGLCCQLHCRAPQKQGQLLFRGTRRQAHPGVT